MLLDKKYFATNNLTAAIQSKNLLFKAIATLVSLQLLACSSSSKMANNRGYLVSTAEISENIASFIGQSVTVRNDISETIGERGFILDQDRILSGETVLVIDTSKNTSKFFGDRTPEIIVNGTVERLDLNDLEQNYSLNLDRNLYARYEGKPVILADSLILSPDPEDLTGNPEIYYDTPLAIKGEVDDPTKYGAFELDEEQAFGGEDLLVVAIDKPQLQLQEEQTVIVYGVLRLFVADELERDYNLGWDLSAKENMKAEYDGKPVFIAEKIRVLNNY